MDAPPPVVPRSSSIPIHGGDFWAFLCTLGGLIPLAASLAGDGAPWWTDLMSPFALHSALALAMAALVWMIRQRPIFAAIAGAALAVQLMRIQPLYSADVPPPTSPERLTILQLNIYYANQSYTDLVGLIAGSDAEIIVVEELTREMDLALEALPPPWTRWASKPDRDSFGIGVWSRLTATSTRVRQLGGAFPVIEATFPWDGGELMLIGAHALPPVDEDATARHREHLAELATWGRSSTVSAIVVGDFNATLWSSGYLGFERVGLHSAALGHGYGGTWPSALGVLGIPIDHVMIPRGLLAVQHEVFEIPGSDHRGLRVVLAPAR